MGLLFEKLPMRIEKGHAFLWGHRAGRQAIKS